MIRTGRDAWPGKVKWPLLSLLSPEERVPERGIARDLPQLDVGITIYDPAFDNLARSGVIYPYPVADRDLANRDSGPVDRAATVLMQSVPERTVSLAHHRPRRR